jgi:hypothetical protein
VVCADEAQCVDLSALHGDADAASFLLSALFLFARVSKAEFVPEMPPKAVVTEAAPIVYRDSLLGISLQMAARELIANQGSLNRFPPFVCLFV